MTKSKSIITQTSHTAVPLVSLDLGQVDLRLGGPCPTVLTAAGQLTRLNVVTHVTTMAAVLVRVVVAASPAVSHNSDSNAARSRCCRCGCCCCHRQ